MSATVAQFWPVAAFVALAAAVVGACRLRRRQRQLEHAAWVAKVRCDQDAQRYAHWTRDDLCGDGIPPETWWRFIYELHRLNRKMADLQRKWEQ